MSGDHDERTLGYVFAAFVVAAQVAFGFFAKDKIALETVPATIAALAALVAAIRTRENKRVITSATAGLSGQLETNGSGKPLGMLVEDIAYQQNQQGQLLQVIAGGQHDQSRRLDSIDQAAALVRGELESHMAESAKRAEILKKALEDQRAVIKAALDKKERRG